MILTYVLTKASPFSLNWGWLSLLGDSSKNSPSLVAPCSPSQLHLWIGLLTDLLLAFLIQEFEPSALEQGEVSIFGSQAAGRGVLCCLCIPLPPFYGFLSLMSLCLQMLQMKALPSALKVYIVQLGN